MRQLIFLAAMPDSTAKIFEEPIILARTLAVLLAAILIAGCAATQDLKNSIKCRESSSIDDYRILEDRLDSVGKSTFFDSALGDAEARDKAADEITRELDALDLKANSLMANAGECFNKVETRDRFDRVKNRIANQRKVVEGYLAKREAAEREQARDTWWARNREYLVRHAGGMMLEIVRIKRVDKWPTLETVFNVKATNTTASTILKPRNHEVWGFEFGSNVGGTRPVGASLTDSFGNNYKFTHIDPSFLGNEPIGIKPGQIIIFEVKFGDRLLENFKFVRLVFEPLTFGQRARAVFEIPSQAFDWEAPPW